MPDRLITVAGQIKESQVVIYKLEEKQKMKLLQLTILMLLLFYSTGTCQVQAINSIHVFIDKITFRDVINKLIERQSYAELCRLKDREISNLEDQGLVKDRIISDQAKSIELYKREIQSLKPKWYQNSVIMSLGTAVLTILTLSLFR